MKRTKQALLLRAKRETSPFISSDSEKQALLFQVKRETSPLISSLRETSSLILMYEHVALGGTFDLLHKGHISLIEKAFKISKLVSIGITTDKFCHASGKYPLESQRERHKNLISYLKSQNLEKRAKIIFLNDIYGTTLTDKTLEAIIVSGDTRGGAEAINKARALRKLQKLKIVEVPMVKNQYGKIISTGAIRGGEITTAGASYKKLLLKISGIRFSQDIREKLKKPFGAFVQGSSLKKIKSPIITVGDVTTARFLKLKITPRLAIVDFLVNRQRVYQNLRDIGFGGPNPDYLVQNTPGQVSQELIIAVKSAFANQHISQVILVDGEEDLAFIPALLMAPIPSVIFYGQPGKGLIRVNVTPNAKNQLCSLLNLGRQR